MQRVYMYVRVLLWVYMHGSSYMYMRVCIGVSACSEFICMCVCL